MHKVLKPKKIMIITGEASGDLHGFNLVNEIKRKDPDVKISGIGGNLLEQAGVDVIFPSHLLSAVGLSEIFSKLPDIFKGMKAARKHLRETMPDLVILVDFPEFNMRIAAYAKKLGIKVLYYISPQIWAWRKGRVHQIKKCVDHMAVILPFEVNFYQKYNMPVTFVGHPLLDNHHLSEANVVDLDARNKLGEDSTICVGILPGSRDKEISKMLPDMIRAAHGISETMGNVKFLIPVARTVKKSWIQDIIEDNPGSAQFDLILEGVDEVFKRSSFLVAVSGTVTLEAAIACVPMVIIYRLNNLSYKVGKLLIKIPNFGLANLIAGRTIIPELLQDEVNPATISTIVCSYLNDEKKLGTMVSELAKIRRRLGESGASSKTADIALSMLR